MARPRFPISAEALAAAFQLRRRCKTLREVATLLRRRRLTRTVMTPATLARAFERAGGDPKRRRQRA